MNQPVRTYNANRVYSNLPLYILSKGMNAGKPMLQPCPNCFVMDFKSDEERMNVYWICYGLWETRHFRKFLVGSVIEFIRIKEFSSEIVRILESQSAQRMKTHIKTLHQIQANLSKQKVLLHAAKMCLLKKVLSCC